MANTSTLPKSSARCKVSWRPFEEKDAPALMFLRVQQEQALGRDLDTPRLLDHPVLISEVAVDEDGRIVGGFFIESYPSIAIIGRSRKVMAEAERYAPEVLARLQQHGFRIVQIEIPKGVPAKERKAMLKQAKRIGKRSGYTFTRIPKSHGFFDLRGL